MLNRVRTFLSKPQNVILLLMGIVLTASTVAPIVAIVQDTIKIHPGTIDEYLSGRSSGYTLANYIDLFTSPLAKRNLWEPLLNTIWLSVGSCAVAILYGGIFAFLITRTNLKARKYLSSIFIFPYIMPQWTLAVVWQHMFSSNAVTGTSNGLLASFGIVMPAWWCVGLFPSVVVLGLHYAPFAYILIGGIFRNMDANLEEAATILDTPKWKTMLRITIPMIKPAILSTILLVFGGAMGSYPVPHYLNLTTLSTKYVSMNDKYTGEASILAIIMMLFGVAIMFANQLSIRSRKNYTTVTGKSGQISKINLGKVGKYIIAVLLIVLTFFTSGKARRAAVLMDAAPMEPRRYTLSRCAASLAGTVLLALAVLVEAAVFYGWYFQWYGWGQLVLPALVTLVPPLVFALGSGWLLGKLRPWLLYPWMAAPLVLSALPLPEALGLWNGRFFSVYPLTLGTLDPNLVLPASVLTAQALLLAAGAVLLCVHPGRAQPLRRNHAA